MNEKFRKNHIYFTYIINIFSNIVREYFRTWIIAYTVDQKSLYKFLEPLSITLNYYHCLLCTSFPRDWRNHDLRLRNSAVAVCGNGRQKKKRVVRCREKERERERESEREEESAARERNHRSDVENTRASRVPTWKRHRQLGSRGPFRGCVLG